MGKHYNTGPFSAPQWWSSDVPDGELLYIVHAVINTWSEEKAASYAARGYVHYHQLVTVDDILASSFASYKYPEALFDDVADILAAEAAGLVTIAKPGVVVLCPIISEEGAEAPGNTELPIQEDEFDDTF